MTMRLFAIGMMSAFLGLGLALGPADARTKRVEVPANKTTVIDSIGLYDANYCHSLLSPPKVKRQAAQGRIVARWINHELTQGNCKGRRIKAIVVEYRPQAGFRGKDEGSIVYRGPQGSRYTESTINHPLSRTYKITVK